MMNVNAKTEFIELFKRLSMVSCKYITFMIYYKISLYFTSFYLFRKRRNNQIESNLKEE